MLCVAPGSEAVVTVNGAMTLMLSGPVAISEFASVNCTVKLLMPLPVGVPEIIPVLEASVSPVGSVPDAMDHVYGVVPPVAASVVLYATFCVALGADVVVSVGPAAGGSAANVATRADHR